MGAGRGNTEERGERDREAHRQVRDPEALAHQELPAVGEPSLEPIERCEERAACRGELGRVGQRGIESR
jgi:hypothetical protein